MQAGNNEPGTPRPSAELSYQGCPVVLAIPNGAVLAQPDAALGMLGYFDTIWRGKMTVLLTCAVFAFAAAAYALLATPLYRAHVVLAPVTQDEMQGALLGQLGGLAGLAGLSVTGQGNAEALAVLKSRQFARSFIQDNNLLPVFYAKEWDATKRQWLENDPTRRPDMRDAVRYFNETICTVREEKTTGLVTLQVEWMDGQVAANWANELARRLNATLRALAAAEAERNIAYLRGELETTSVLTLQQAISNLLEREMQKLMMARGNEQFAFRVIDPAEPPKKRSWPARTLIVAAAVAAGGLLAILFLLVRNEIRKHRPPGLP